MSNYIEAFKFSLYVKPNSETVIRYALLRKNGNISTFYFVEGKTDEIFYGHLKNEKTIKPPAEYISGSENNNPDSESKFIGKTAVLEAFSEINKNDDLKQGIHKCVFLIDRDYDGISTSKIKIAPKDKNKFTVTPYHSLECFFLNEINLPTLFKFFDVIESLELFRSMLNEFSKESREYFALQGAITNCCNMNIKTGYYTKYKTAEIFAFKFLTKNTYDFNKQYLEDETALMKKAVFQNDFAIQVYKTIYKQISESYLNIHGHTIFNFLQEYLFQTLGEKFNISLTDKNFIEIIDKIVIDMPIVYGDGSIL